MLEYFQNSPERKLSVSVLVSARLFSAVSSSANLAYVWCRWSDSNRRLHLRRKEPPEGASELNSRVPNTISRLQCGATLVFHGNFSSRHYCLGHSIIGRLKSDRFTIIAHSMVTDLATLHSLSTSCFVQKYRNHFLAVCSKSTQIVAESGCTYGQHLQSLGANRLIAVLWPFYRPNHSYCGFRLCLFAFEEPARRFRFSKLF